MVGFTRVWDWMSNKGQIQSGLMLNIDTNSQFTWGLKLNFEQGSVYFVFDVECRTRVYFIRIIGLMSNKSPVSLGFHVECRTMVNLIQVWGWILNKSPLHSGFRINVEQGSDSIVFEFEKRTQWSVTLGFEIECRTWINFTLSHLMS